MEDDMACKELVELVTEYLENSLPDDARQRFEKHISGCDGCTAYLDQMRQTIRLTGRIIEENLTSQQRDDLLKLFHDWHKS